MLMVFLPPRDDELLYSWVHRLAEANDVPYKIFMDSFFLTDGLAAGGKRSFFVFADSLQLDNPGMWFLNLTTFGFESFFMSRGMQTKSVLPAFRFKNDLNSIDITDFKHIRVCSDCIREELAESGEWYSHRSHQLSGVCVCHKHGIELKVMPNLPVEFHSVPEKLMPIELVTENRIELEYALFSKKILDMGIATDYETVFRKFSARCGDRKQFVCEFAASKYASLYKSGIPLEEYLSRAGRAKSVLPDNLLPMVMYCYDGDAEAFCKDVDLTAETPAGFEGYELQHDYGVLKLYKHLDCGNVFLMTEYGMKMGFGCPYCEKSEPEDASFERIVFNITGGEYEVVTPFESMWDKVVLRHMNCGNEFPVRAGNFLFKETRCKCRKKHTEAERKANVESHEGFTYVGPGKEHSKIIVRHDECGCEFELSYFVFMKRPYCRSCCPLRAYSPDTAHEEYVRRVRELTGDEYTIVSEVAKHRGALIRHNTCGRVYEYQLSKFFNGFRCRHCVRPVRFPALSRMVKELTSGRYRLETLGLGGDSRIIDTVTGRGEVLQNRLILQEIRRPTRSDIVILDDEQEKARLARLHKYYGNNFIDSVYAEVKEKFKAGELITYDDFNRNQKYIDALIYLCRKGKIVRIMPGHYVLSDEDNEENSTD